MTNLKDLSNKRSESDKKYKNIDKCKKKCKSKSYRNKKHRNQNNLRLQNKIKEDKISSNKIKRKKRPKNSYKELIRYCQKN